MTLESNHSFLENSDVVVITETHFYQESAHLLKNVKEMEINDKCHIWYREATGESESVRVVT